MKLSDLIKSQCSNGNLKAKLKVRIKLDNGTVLRKGTVSEFLIRRDDGTYHFEANNTACRVKIEEIEFIA